MGDLDGVGLTFKKIGNVSIVAHDQEETKRTPTGEHLLSPQNHDLLEPNAFQNAHTAVLL